VRSDWRLGAARDPLQRVGEALALDRLLFQLLGEALALTGPTLISTTESCRFGSDRSVTSHGGSEPVRGSGRYRNDGRVPPNVASARCGFIVGNRDIGRRRGSNRRRDRRVIDMRVVSPNRTGPRGRRAVRSAGALFSKRPGGAEVRPWRPAISPNGAPV
jgi:hypothetical protein